MAGNDWINSYLEAILDAGGAPEEISAATTTASGAAREKRDKSSLMLRERGRFSPARYFVEEVISGFDETDLYKTWVRVSFTSVAAFLFLPPPDRSESPIVRRRLELVVLTLWRSRVFLVDCFLLFFLDPDGGDEEPAGAQHAAGEHVVEDLEPCPEEEAGTRFSQLMNRDT
jgi:hypothetical protein